MKSLEKRLRPLGEHRTYEKGYFVFSTEDDFDGIYYVVSGLFCLFRMGPKGRQLQIKDIGPGQIIGLPPLLSDLPKMPAYCHALKRSEVIFIKKQVISRELEKDKELLAIFSRMVSDSYCQLTERLDVLTLKTPEQRMILYLISKCAKSQHNFLKLEIKKVDLAKHLDMAPETLSRILSKLQKENAIRVQKRVIFIKNSLILRQKLFS